MKKFPPRRFLVNFVDGTAEFNDDATPPAQEYVSLIEYENLQEELAEMTDNHRVTSELFEALSMDHGVLQEKLRDEMKYTDYLKEQLKESQEAHLEECRINGMGAQRELRLMAELKEANNLIEKLKVHAADRRDLFRGLAKKQRELKKEIAYLEKTNDILHADRNEVFKLWDIHKWELGIALEALENISNYYEPSSTGALEAIAAGALTKLKGKENESV